MCDNKMITIKLTLGADGTDLEAPIGRISILESVFDTDEETSVDLVQVSIIKDMPDVVASLGRLACKAIDEAIQQCLRTKNDSEMMTGGILGAVSVNLGSGEIREER